jgi:predicted PurR-regulated permease PerM
VKQSWLTLTFLVALLAVTLGVVLAIFRVFLQPVAFAAILGVGLYPLHAWMQRWVGGKSGPALLSTLVVCSCSCYLQDSWPLR